MGLCSWHVTEGRSVYSFPLEPREGSDLPSSPNAGVGPRSAEGSAWPLAKGSLLHDGGICSCQGICHQASSGLTLWGCHSTRLPLEQGGSSGTVPAGLRSVHTLGWLGLEDGQVPCIRPLQRER